MIPAIEARCNALMNISAYCDKNIEPKILKATGTSVLFGCYYEDGSASVIHNGCYRNEPPYMNSTVAPSANAIANYLTLLGYEVELVENDYKYPAGHSDSGRTIYYKGGCIRRWMLKISF